MSSTYKTLYLHVCLELKDQSSVDHLWMSKFGPKNHHLCAVFLGGWVGQEKYCVLQYCENDDNDGRSLKMT